MSKFTFKHIYKVKIKSTELIEWMEQNGEKNDNMSGQHLLDPLSCTKLDANVAASVSDDKSGQEVLIFLIFLESHR